jgi:ParB family chromosome partitioning protein
MARFKYGLGRGLESLIPPPATQDDPALQLVDIDLIAPNPQQPRTRFEPAALEELADSIREHGLIQPLIVSRAGSSYQLIAGERRLQAARLAGVDRLPVVVREAAEGERLELALVENLQREDLNPLEEGMAFRRLIDEFGLTQEQVAARVGRSRVAVANTLRLLGLPEEIRASLAQGDITEGHARALLAMESDEARLAAWRRVVDEGLTVRQTEELARAAQTSAASTPAPPQEGKEPRPRDADIVALERQLMELLATKVRVERRRKGARIVIDCYDDEQLFGVVETLLR